METKNIDLHFKRSDFEEIYFRDGRKSVFFHPDVKRDAWVVIVLTIICVALLIRSYFTLYDTGMVIVPLILWAMMLLVYLGKLKPVWRWRKAIDKYLNDLDQVKNFELYLNKDSFRLIQDDRENIEKWANIKHVEMDDNSIFLDGGTLYMFPKASMSDEDYELFKIMISEKTSV